MHRHVPSTTRQTLWAVVIGLGLTLAATGSPIRAEETGLTGECCVREEFTTVQDSIDARVGNVVEDDEALAQRVKGNDLREDDDDDDDEEAKRRRR